MLRPVLLQDRYHNMANITVRARVRRDGTLSIPRAAREALGLHEGDLVEISVSKPDSAAETIETDPLLAIIGIGKGGLVDGAADHDTMLYRRSAG